VADQMGPIDSGGGDDGGDVAGHRSQAVVGRARGLTVTAEVEGDDLVAAREAVGDRVEGGC
jgi:hypothetical protein